jgi:hypothetical protein
MADALDPLGVMQRAELFDAKQLAEPRRQPLNAPIWTDAYDHLRADDPVLGFYMDRRAWALPWWIMADPHVANLVLDARPVLVTLCPICSTGAAFRPEVQGRRLGFRLRGKYNGTMLMADTATDSLWSPSTGVALAGMMRGAELERLPLSQCLWNEWLQMHPSTKVLYAERAARRAAASDDLPGSPNVPPRFIATLVRPLDERLPHNGLVLGAVRGEHARAYPLQTLARIGPVLNDSLGGIEIVVRCRPGTLQALAFHRRLGEHLLDFHCPEGGNVVLDHQTGSVWNEMGEAVSGPLAGSQLAYFDSGVGEWYEFAAAHPDAEIFATI